MRLSVFICFLFFSFSTSRSEAQNITISTAFKKLNNTPANNPSLADTVVISFNAFSNGLKIVCDAPFEVSQDNISFNDTLQLPNSFSNQALPLYVRFLPSNQDSIYRGSIRFQNNNFVLNERIYVLGASIAENNLISFCTWNMRWFGSPSQCNCDTTIARENASSILQEIQADVYALQEVVSIPTLEQVIAELGPNYDYSIADYCSQIDNSNQAGYESCQKLAFVYNKNKVNNNGTFGLLRSTYPMQQGTSSPYYYFSSGRWPYVMKANLLNTADTVYFVNLHAKAFAGSTDHNRRAGGAVKMTDSLNALYNQQKVIILGDYNDKLEGAITAGFTVSPYDYLFQNGFAGITKPSRYPGQTSYLGSTTSLIDNICMSNRAYAAYIPGTTAIINEVDNAFNNYKNTTSDHLPVLSFLKVNSITSTNNIPLNKSFRIIQPFGKTLRLLGPSLQNNQVSVSIMTMSGNAVFDGVFSDSEKIEVTIPGLVEGIYIVSLRTANGVEQHKWLVD